MRSFVYLQEPPRTILHHLQHLLPLIAISRLLPEALTASSLFFYYHLVDLHIIVSAAYSKGPFDVTRNSGFSTYTTVFPQSTGCCRTAPLKKQAKSSGFSLGSPPKTPLLATPLEILHSVNKTLVWSNGP